MAKRQALGKGLNALLSDVDKDITSRTPAPLNTITEINISDIEANPFQPREQFNEEELDELVKSIQIHGLIQPVTVRKIGYGKYQLISGERRTRAAIRAGLKKIPAYIRVADDQQMLEMSLIENIHREDLNPIEIAISYKRLIEECNLKQEEVASRIGKNRTTVTNYLRLLKLPEEIQLALRDKKITFGHARTLITIEDKETQLKLLNHFLSEDINVRDAEKMVRELREKPVQTEQKKKSGKSRRLKDWEEKLSHYYTRPVKVKSIANGKAQVIITFDSREEMESFYSKLQ